VFVIDYNKVEAKGFVNQDMTLEPLVDKLRAFNLQVYETRNGHDVSELVGAFNQMIAQRRGQPQALILNTIKGKKVRECQFNPNWHTSTPRNIASAGVWLKELWDQDGRRLGIPEEFYLSLTQMIEFVPPQHENPDQMIDRQA
jgi:transketolase